MSKKSHIVSVDGEYSFPRGFTISDNRIEDMLQRHLNPSEYVIWRQYLRFWGSNKKKAYPSLSYLSNVTGLSEKTIRKCNKGLRAKKFLSYISGGPGRSNLYTYKPIEKIIKYYYGSEDAKNVVVEEEPAPIREKSSDDTIKVNEILKQIPDKEFSKLDTFLTKFGNSYLAKYGYSYEVDERDAKVLVGKVVHLVNIGNFINLVDIFFGTKNAYINKSDRSIFFFFRPTVIKALVSEYSDTDKGRWEAQAGKMWTDLKSKIPAFIVESQVKQWVQDNTHLGSANKKRDEYVLAILVERVKEDKSI